MAVRKIVVKGDGIRKEGDAAATVNPGYLIDRDSNGDIIPHGVAAGNAGRTFAVENELIGKEVSVAYTTGERTYFDALPSGAEVNAKLAAAAAAIVIGDYLESAGDGTLRKVVTAAATADVSRSGVIARALEAVNNSGGGTEVFIKVELL